jgi:hypothetical protein
MLNTMNRLNTLSILAVVGLSASASQAHEPARLLQTSGEKIEQQYIVRLTGGSDRQSVMDAVFADMPTASVMYEYDFALNGFTVSGVAEESIMNIADRFPGVVLEVEEDAKSHAVAAPVVWGLDRLDDMKLLLDGSFIANVNGEGVDVYILDVSFYSSCSCFDLILCHDDDDDDDDAPNTSTPWLLTVLLPGLPFFHKNNRRAF